MTFSISTIDTCTFWMAFDRLGLFCRCTFGDEESGITGLGFHEVQVQIEWSGLPTDAGVYYRPKSLHSLKIGA